MLVKKVWKKKGSKPRSCNIRIRVIMNRVIMRLTCISNLSVQQSNNHPLGAVDDPMNCCPRPSALGNSSSGHPQHLVCDNFDCCPERYEIVVYCQSVFLRLLFLTLVLQVAIIVCLRLFYTESDRIVVSLIQNDSFGRYILPVIKQVPRADLAWTEPVWSINWLSLKRCLSWNRLVTDGLLMGRDIV